jgi:type I restriction enzyme S subunit
MFGDPVSNPRNYPIVKLSDIGTLDRGISKNRPRNAPELYGGPYPFVQTGDIANSSEYISSYIQTYSESGLKQSKLWPEGT